jgi:plasmid stabilization system protein ParE
MFTLAIEREAELDIAMAAAWYEAQRAGLGVAFLEMVRTGLASVERTPLLHREVLPGVRRVALRRFPYLLFFVVRGETVAVIACLHARRDPQLWSERAGR